MPKRGVALCILVIVVSGLSGPAIAVAADQPTEGQSSSVGGNAQSTPQPVIDRTDNGFSQTSTDVDTESNYDQSNASVVDDGEYTSLVSENWDIDYYAVELAEDEELAAAIQHDDSRGELDLAIVDANGNYLTGGSATDGIESVGIEAGATDEPYYIRVTNEDERDTDIEYDLLIETGDNATASYGDRFEPNYDRDIATPLGDGEYFSLISTDGDLDYYAVNVSDDGELEAAIEYDSTAGELDLSIEDSNENYLNGSATDDGTGYTTATVGSDVTYYIVVENTGESAVQYNLSINPSVSTSTPTATTEVTTTATQQETPTTDQPPVTQTQTRSPAESRTEYSTERVTADELDDTEPETSSGGSGPGFTGSIAVSALLISVYIGIRTL